jgi:ribosomal protein L24
MQDAIRAEKEYAENPWDTHGRITVGDFISVLWGDQAGKDGFVMAITEDYNLIVGEANRAPGQPPILYHGQQMDEELQVGI